MFQFHDCLFLFPVSSSVILSLYFPYCSLFFGVCPSVLNNFYPLLLLFHCFNLFLGIIIFVHKFLIFCFSLPCYFFLNSLPIRTAYVWDFVWIFFFYLLLCDLLTFVVHPSVTCSTLYSFSYIFLALWAWTLSSPSCSCTFWSSYLLFFNCPHFAAPNLLSVIWLLAAAFSFGVVVMFVSFCFVVVTSGSCWLFAFCYFTSLTGFFSSIFSFFCVLLGFITCFMFSSFL